MANDKGLRGNYEHWTVSVPGRPRRPAMAWDVASENDQCPKTEHQRRYRASRPTPWIESLSIFSELAVLRL